MKKELRVISVLCILLGMFFSMTNPAVAASSAMDIHSRLEEISAVQGFTPGTTKDANYCWKFVNAISPRLFGVDIPSGPSGYQLTNASSNSNWYCVGSETSNTAIEALLRQAQPGDIIQYKSSGAKWQHTAMIYAKSDYGVSVYDSAPPYKDAGYQAVRKYTCAWNEIFRCTYEKGLGSFDTDSSYGLSLYRCNKNVITGYIAPTTSGTSTKVSVGTPSKPSASVNGQNVTVSWNSVSNAQYYNVYLVTDPWGWEDIKYSGETSGTSYTFTNVNPGDYQTFVIARPNADNVQSEWTLLTVQKPVVENAKISLDRRQINLYTGESTQIMATSVPANIPLSWSSTNPSVAEVDNNGKVKALSAGSTTINVSGKTSNSTLLSFCFVDVKDKVITPPGAAIGAVIGAGTTDIKLPSDEPEISKKPETPPAEPESTLNLPVKGVSNVSQTTARVDASCSYSGARPSSVGLYLGTSSSNMSQWGSDNINHNKNPFDIWYNLNGLSAGTTYYYQFYAIVNGRTVYSEINSFTTTPAPVADNTRTGLVVNTNGEYLAINDRPSSSANGSSIQIGRIPPGGWLTVYPDKRSGNWYWVEYNGVSGYAYNRYIALQ